MMTAIRKMGEAFVIVLPAEVVEKTGWIEGSNVTVTLEGDAMIASTKPRRKKYTLEELCAQIKPEHLHPETNWGPAVGKEIIDG